MKKYEVKVKSDYESGFSWDMYIDYVKELAIELDIAVHNSNRRMSNLLPSKKIDTDGYHKSCIVGCKGYSQSDWDDYKIYYNEESKELELLKEQISRAFTHKHDYWIETIETLESGHSKVIDSCVISIDWIEFPDENDIKDAVRESEIYFGLKLIDNDLLTWNFAI
tara:strand:+ start:2320 stop:2817 length:498 start_codon:yes stop_codon:yes gene_type:complete